MERIRNLLKFSETKKARNAQVFKGITPVNWIDALTKEQWSWEELKNMERAAGNWVTCACGNQCDIIPRKNWKSADDDFGQPDDPELYRLGMQFYQIIQKLCSRARLDSFNEKTRMYEQSYAIEHYAFSAMETLKLIEKRSMEVIKWLREHNAISDEEYYV